MQAEQIAKALGNAKRVGKGWLASCPLPTHGQGHGDKNPSLSISDGEDGKPLFKCHSGCDQHELFHAIRDYGLLPEIEKRDPLANIKPLPTLTPQVLEHEWVYVDEDGEPLYVKQRFKTASAKGKDYTQKTQALAEQRKAIEAEKAAVDQAKTLRDQYAQRLEMIEQVLKQQEPQEDLNALKESDPIGYAVKVAEQQQRQQQLYAIQAEKQRLALQQQTEHQQRLQQLVAEEQQKLAQAIPEFADPQKGNVVRTEIRDYAKQVGFTDDDLAQVYDSRAVLTLWKASQYDKLVKGKPEVTKKVTEAPKMLRPGAANSAPPEQKQYQTQRKVLRQSGKAKDAAAIFERFL